MLSCIFAARANIVTKVGGIFWQFSTIHINFYRALLGLKEHLMSNKLRPDSFDKELEEKATQLAGLMEAQDFSSQNSDDSHPNQNSFRNSAAQRPQDEVHSAPNTKRKLSTFAGISSLLLVGIITGGILWASSTWGTPGEDGGWFNPFTSSKAKEDIHSAAEARGQMRNAPYTDVNLQDVIDHRIANIEYDPDSLLVVNVNHPLKTSYLATLYKVPFEQAKANPKAANAYKYLNVAVDKQFGSSIDLERAYIKPNSDDGMLPSNVDNTMGLAFDLRAPGYKRDSFLSSGRGKYVLENASRWGFVLRYPKGKEAQTGIEGLEYKFRYVGIPHAEIIQKESLCLDEYPEFLSTDKEYEYAGYVISRQKGPVFKVPSSASRVKISPDNTGYYVISAFMLDHSEYEKQITSIPQRSDGVSPPKKQGDSTQETQQNSKSKDTKSKQDQKSEHKPGQKSGQKSEQKSEQNKTKQQNNKQDNKNRNN